MIVPLTIKCVENVCDKYQNHPDGVLPALIKEFGCHIEIRKIEPRESVELDFWEDDKAILFTLKYMG